MTDETVPQGNSRSPGWIADLLNADPEQPSRVTHLDGTRGTVIGWQEGSEIVTVEWDDGALTEVDEDSLTVDEP